MVNNYFSNYLSLSGDGLGTVQVIGDHTPAEFYYQTGPTQQVAITRIIIHIADGVTGRFAPENYGDLSALTNGITVQVRGSDDTLINDLTHGHPIKTNGQWQALCFDVRTIWEGLHVDFVA